MAGQPDTSPSSRLLSTQVLSNRLILLMAIATGAVAANLYYAQPLLHQISLGFHVGSTASSTVITATQLGYAASLLLVVPLGDHYPRRKLVSRIYYLLSVALVLCAISPNLWIFAFASVGVGAASVAGQVMIPFAADLATPSHRGRVVARMMTGLLLGILMARTVSGVVAQLAGWRAIYWISAALMVLFGIILRRVLPPEHPRKSTPYWSLVGSSLALLAKEPVLRRRAWHGGCVFASFSVLWTAIAFLLSGSPYHYSNAAIGLFGLAGVAGVLAANLAGKLADSNKTAVSTIATGLLTMASFLLLGFGRYSLILLILGVIVLDLGTQGMQITNQAIIYSLRPDLRSRINSAYMFCYFVGGALGSIGSGVIYAKYGWYGVCVLGAGFGALSVSAAIFGILRPIEPKPVPTRKNINS